MDPGHRPARGAGRGRGGGKIDELIHPEPGVEIERQIAAAPETVFSYLTDPAKFVAWMGARAELDPRPGGRFRIEVETGAVAAGEYREVEPPHRLVFSWGWEGNEAVPPGSTTVEITVAPAGAGSLLRLRHHGLPDAEQEQLHQSGWNLYADRLTGLFGQQPDGRGAQVARWPPDGHDSR